MSDFLFAFADRLLDQQARLDDLYERAGRRASRSLQPILAQLRRTLQAQAAELLAGTPDDAALERLAVATAEQHRRLDHLPGMTMPVESDYLLADLLGATAGADAPPPVVLTPEPVVGSRAFAPGLVSLQLPLMYRESPLAWTLLAGELGEWLAGRTGVVDSLLGARRAELSAATQTWLTRHVADLIALRLVGPAYVAALALHLPPCWLATASDERPCPARRMMPLIRTLQARGFTSAWLTTWAERLAALPKVHEQPTGFAGLAAEAVERVAALPGLPDFRPGDLAVASALVAELREGLPISAAPRLPKAEQEARLAVFRAQGPQLQPGSAVDLLALLTDRPNSAAVILNAGWLYRLEIGTGWLTEVRAHAPAEALNQYRARAAWLDQLLEKSIETAELHRLMQEEAK